MEFTPYDSDRDWEACLRIWHEVGWIPSRDRASEERCRALFGAGRARVARMDGSAECLVLAAPGTVRYLERELAFSGITGVTTSPIARRQGLATRLTAQVIAEEAEAGASVSGLGAFEQGFYDRLGYGAGTYDHEIRLDPAQLKVDFPKRAPRRLGVDDAESLHTNRLGRHRKHGSVSLTPSAITRSDVLEVERGFALGFFDGAEGGLSHHVWFDVHSAAHGPYRARWMAYETAEQYMELLGVIRSLGDQVRSVIVYEPSGIQFQEFLRHPIQHRMMTRQSRFELGIDSLAWWQMRVCDLGGCLANTHLPGESVRFNLVLGDPIAHHLDDEASWRGVGGEYVVTLGPESSSRSGLDSSLDTLSCSVNAFTRLWLGVRPATGLAVTNGLEGPPRLLHALDSVLRVPRPVIDWFF